MLDNVVTGQIFMAIENIHSKCLEIDNSIKVFKGAKKQDSKQESIVEKMKKESENLENKKNENDMLSLTVANEKLRYILHSLQDFKEILKKEKQKL